MERFNIQGRPRAKSKEEVDKSSRAHLKAHQSPFQPPSTSPSSHLIDMRLITEIRRRERRFSRMFMAVEIEPRT